MDEARRRLITETDELKRQRNAASEEIGRLKKAGQDTSAGQAEVKALGRQIAENDSELRRLETDLRAALLAIPNLPHANVPLGSDASGNVEVRRWGAQRVFDFTPQSHLVLGESLGILDFARATRLSGTGFPLLVGAGARLERALVRFMLDMHTREHDYLEVAPPYLCNAAAMTGTGQLPKMAEDMYHLPVDGLYLAPTAEVPVTNIYREEILERDLPIRLVALAMFPPRSRRRRPRNAGIDPGASVRQSGNGEIHSAGSVLCGTGNPDRQCRRCVATLGIAIPRYRAMRRRFELCRRKMLRHRIVGARPECLAGSLFLQ